MNSLNGFIKLFRKFKVWGWYKDSVVKCVFIHLLLTANFEPMEWNGTVLKEGQLATSIKSLSEDLGFSSRQVRTALSKLSSTNEITTKATNKFTVITIVNWRDFQGSSRRSDKQNFTDSDKRATSKTTNKMTSKTTNKNASKVQCLSEDFNADENLRQAKRQAKRQTERQQYKNNKEVEDINSTKFISSTDLIQEQKSKTETNPSLPRALGGAQADGISLKDIRTYQVTNRIGDGDMASTFYHAFVDSKTEFPKNWQTVYALYATAERSKQEQFIDELHKGKYKSQWGERKC